LSEIFAACLTRSGDPHEFICTLSGHSQGGNLLRRQKWAGETSVCPGEDVRGKSLVLKVLPNWHNRTDYTDGQRFIPSERCTNSEHGELSNPTFWLMVFSFHCGCTVVVKPCVCNVVVVVEGCQAQCDQMPPKPSLCIHRHDTSSALRS